ncbi:hypothetical protein [Arthrobacter castelli]|uniref:hypothetical protein n=1 Tax=Arthrobacter castelli TaxID=271431 RepID=UPI001FE0C51B|nr:hypothetical protein [Arthrobacter castelli]
MSASAASAWSIALEKDGWTARVETRSHLSAEAEKFVLTNTVTAYARRPDAEEELVATTDWHDVIPRTSA